MDYFSRALWAKILSNKRGKEIVGVLRKWFEKGPRPVEIITDNEKEFGNEELRKLC